ncbi:MAG TPA: DUF1611 domain-containing protein [Candidatus Obscuribacterales bacterium]
MQRSGTGENPATSSRAPQVRREPRDQVLAAMYYSQTARIAIFADGEFGKGRSKTAEGVIRYGKNPVVAVIDRTETGKTVEDLLGVACRAPIVASVEEALRYQPDALLLGTAWTGGQLPRQWRPHIIKAIESGLDVINGLHDFLSDDPEIFACAQKHHRKLLDVRRPPADLEVASGKAATVPAMTVLTVGSDCSVGKMTASLELTAEAKNAGFRAKFIATGQTGIMICGEGIAIDRVIGDFMAGAAEKMVVEAGFDNDFVFVEGQGSLVHPGFSGVTLALLHGSCPAAMILCHKANKTHIGELPFPIPPLAELVTMYEYAAAAVRPSKVLAIALNTAGMTEKEAREAVSRAEAETGLPASDPVRFGAGKLLQAILRESKLDRAAL